MRKTMADIAYDPSFMLIHSQYIVWLDTGGISSPYSGNGLRCCQLLGAIVQYCIAEDRIPSFGIEHQRAPLLSRIRSLGLHDMHYTNATKVYGL